MKKIILGLCAFIMNSVEVQARVAFVDPGELSGVSFNIADNITTKPVFYESPLIIGGAIFVVLFLSFVLFLKSRK